MVLIRRGKHLLRRLHSRLLAARCRRRQTGARCHYDEAVRLVLLLSRPQDVDLYLDIYRQARERPEIRVKFWATRRAMDHFPVMPGRLAEHELKVEQVVDHHNLGRVAEKLYGIDALLNTVESSYAAHKVPHRLVQLANACGVMTYTLQHGFENLGLTYLDEEQGSGVTFAARRVLSWGKVEELPGRLAAETREKCVPVGCPKKFTGPAGKVAGNRGRPLISIFEGLHAPRFDTFYRERFFADLEAMVEEFGNFRFVLKPHPGVVVRAADHQAGIEALAEKIEVIDPLHPRPGIDLNTPELLASSRAVITTPSTIALDAALVGVPVAVVRYGQEIPYYDLYRPLPLLDELVDWRSFLERCGRKPEALSAVSRVFRDRVMLPGSAARRILDLVLNDCRQESS